MDTENIEVHAIGTEVMIDGDIPATIRRIEIRGATVGKLVSYECVWWDERTRKTEWLEADEIRPKDSNRKTKISLK